MKFGIVGIALAVALAGCGGGAAAGSPAPAPSPTPDLPALQRAYKAAADKSNAAQDAVQAKLDAGTIDKTAEFLGAADIERQFVADLDAVSWPTSMQADERDLSKAGALFEQVLRQMAAAKSTLEQATLIGDFTKAKAAEAAATSRLKRDLKLP